MMELLHEEFRECCEGSYIFDVNGTEVSLWQDEAFAIADEVEQKYSPLPRYRTGKPIAYEDLSEYGTIIGFVTYLGGMDKNDVGLLTKENGIVNIPKNELLAPLIKVRDRDGAFFFGGERVFNRDGEPLIVIDPVSADASFPYIVCCRDRYGESSNYDPAELTHYKPHRDCDGRPTRLGDKVWDIRIEMKDNPFWGRQLTVVEVAEAGIVVAPSLESGATMSAPAHHFSHEKPQFDRQGIRCAPGDIVFGLGREQHRYKVLSEELDVEKCEAYEDGRFTLPCLDLTEGDKSVCFLDPSMVSHKEPESYEELQEMLRKENSEEDSYEKLRDEMRATEGPVGTITAGKWADRLTALMERDQNMVNNHSIIIDRTKLDSPHLMILGKPGASVWKRSFALQELKQGKISIEDLLNTQDECLRRILIYDLLRAYKGIGNARARKIMKELHIAEARRIADLDKLQHTALLDFIQERDL